MSRNRIVVLVALLALAIAVIVNLTASEETRIRRQLARIEKHFNDQRAGALSRQVGERITYARYSLDRDEVKAYLLREFFRDGIGAEYPWRVEIPADESSIVVEGEGEDLSATVTARFHFKKRKGAGWIDQEPMEATFRFEKIESEWLIVRLEQLPRQGPIRY